MGEINEQKYKRSKGERKKKNKIKKKKKAKKNTEIPEKKNDGKL